MPFTGINDGTKLNTIAPIISTQCFKAFYIF